MESFMNVKTRIANLTALCDFDEDIIINVNPEEYSLLKKERIYYCNKILSIKIDSLLMFGFSRIKCRDDISCYIIVTMSVHGYQHSVKTSPPTGSDIIKFIESSIESFDNEKIYIAIEDIDFEEGNKLDDFINNNNMVRISTRAMSRDINPMYWKFFASLSFILEPKGFLTAKTAMRHIQSYLKSYTEEKIVNLVKSFHDSCREKIDKNGEIAGEESRSPSHSPCSSEEGSSFNSIAELNNLFDRNKLNYHVKNERVQFCKDVLKAPMNRIMMLGIVRINSSINDVCILVAVSYDDFSYIVVNYPPRATELMVLLDDTIPEDFPERKYYLVMENIDLDEPKLFKSYLQENNMIQLSTNVPARDINPMYYNVFSFLSVAFVSSGYPSFEGVEHQILTLLTENFEDEDGLRLIKCLKESCARVVANGGELQDFSMMAINH